MANGRKFRRRGSDSYDGGCSKRRPVIEDERREASSAPVVDVFDVDSNTRNLR